MNRVKLLLIVGAALYVLGRNLPAALLLLFPSLWRARETDDDGSLDPLLGEVQAELATAGFRKLGAIVLLPPLARSQAELVYGAPELSTFADVDAHGGALRLTLFTPFEGGEAVLTSDYARPGRNDPDVLIGGLPAHNVAGLWAAHRRRVSQLADGPLQAIPWKDISLRGRLQAEQRFYRGAGKRLLRLRGVLPALWVVTALLFAVLGGLQFVALI